MPSSEAVALERAHRAQLAAIRAEVVRQAEARYTDLDPADIASSFEAMAPDIVARLEDGQRSAQEAAAAYIEAYVAEESGRSYRAARFARDVVGTRADGETSLLDGLRPVAGMILASIARGASTEQAVESGLHFTTRFADSETLAAADREIAHQMQASPRIRGWQRITAGAKTCKPCSTQLSGGPGDKFYRHAACNCGRIPRVA